MHPWQNKTIFGLAKELSLDIETLRDIAADINDGLRSVSKLNVSQGGQMIKHLRSLVNRNKKELAPGHEPTRPDQREWDYLKTGKWSQEDLLFDYVLKVGWNLWDLRGWIRKYFKVDHEGWLSKTNMNKAIEGLKAMYNRQRKA